MQSSYQDSAHWGVLMEEVASAVDLLLVEASDELKMNASSNEFFFY